MRCLLNRMKQSELGDTLDIIFEAHEVEEFENIQSDENDIDDPLFGNT